MMSASKKSLPLAVGTLTVLKLVMNAGYRFVYPFLPAIGRGLGVDLNQMGLLVSLRWGAGFTVPIAVGVAGRANRSRRLLFVGLIAFGLGSLVTAVTGVFVGAIVGFILIGIGKPVFDIGSQSYVSERVPYRRRARFLGILELSWAGGFLLGAPLAGWLIDTWNWTVPFWVIGSMALLSIGAVMLLLDPSDGMDVSEAPNRTDGPLARTIPFLIVIMIAGFALEVVFVVLGAWLENEFGLTLLGLAGIGALLGFAELTGEGAMLSFTDRIGKRNSLALGLGAASAALFVLASVNQVFRLGVAALALVTVCIEFAFISGIPLATELRPQNRSRFLAWFLVASGLGRMIGDLTGPVIFQRGGMTAIATVAGISAALGLVILLTKVEEVESPIWRSETVH